MMVDTEIRLTGEILRKEVFRGNIHGHGVCRLKSFRRKISLDKGRVFSGYLRIGEQIRCFSGTAKRTATHG